jgi:hypothetical protein
MEVIMPKLNLILSQDEFFALLDLAEVQLRLPAEQVHYMVRHELVSCGLLLQDGTLNAAPLWKVTTASEPSA